MAESFVGHLGYFGIILILILGGLGLPVPEEAPVVLAAILSAKKSMWWPWALGSCFIGVLTGDFVVYILGYVYGEKVLRFRLTRKFLTKPREAQIKGYFHRHGIKILILGRFAVGFRTAAYLTAGILRLPPLRMLLADLFAASLTTLLVFGLGFWFADWIETGLREAKHYAALVAAALVAALLIYRYYRGRQRAGLPVGPPVPITDVVPLPPDDLHPGAPPVALADAAGPPASANSVAEPTANGLGLSLDIEPVPAPSPPAEPAEIPPGGTATFSVDSES